MEEVVICGELDVIYQWVHPESSMRPDVWFFWVTGESGVVRLSYFYLRLFNPVNPEALFTGMMV